MKKIIVIILVLVFGSTFAKQQNEDVKQKIIYVKNILAEGSIKNNLSLLFEGQAIMERLYLSNPSRITLYYLTYAEHEIIKYSLASRDDELFDKTIDIAIEHAEKLVEQDKNWSEALALLSSLYGMKISKSWIYGPFLGPKSSELVDLAVKKDSSNPRAWLIRGISKFNTPSFFGGSVEEALLCFLRSVKLFETISPKDSIQPNWGYLDALAWLGITYEKLGQLSSALEVYHKALKIEPNYAWVKFVLLPGLEKKLKQQKSK